MNWATREMFHWEELLSIGEKDQVNFSLIFNQTNCQTKLYKYFLGESGEFFMKLKELIEVSYSTNNNQRVTLIGFSLGCLMTLELLQRQTQHWKDKYVQRFVALAGPWGGSMDVVKRCAVQTNILEKTHLTFSSGGILLPSEVVWNKNKTVVESLHKNYTVTDMRQLFMCVKRYFAFFQFR